MHEIEFTKRLLIALSSVRGVRVHRQNCGQIPVRNNRGEVVRYFDAGPPNGAADISGWVAPEGWRLEVELKVGRRKRSREQEAWARVVESSGCVYALCVYDENASVDKNVDFAVLAVRDAIKARRGQ